MNKFRFFTALTIMVGLAAISGDAPVRAQTDCRGACGWQAHNCELGCPPTDTSEGRACLNACQAAYRDCTANCD